MNTIITLNGITYIHQTPEREEELYAAGGEARVIEMPIRLPPIDPIRQLIENLDLQPKKS